MKVNANGINFNYQIDGPEGAPWIIFSNSLITNLSMWDDQAARAQERLPHPALRPARPRRHRRAGRQVLVRYAHPGRDRADGRAVDQAREFLRHLDGRHDRAVPGAAPRRPLRPHLPLRLRPGVDAAVRAAMEGAHRPRRREGHGGAGRRRPSTAGFRRNSSPPRRRCSTRSAT